MSWLDKPNTYKKYGFIEIPEGNHRVQICKASVKKYKYDKRCYELALKISGHHTKLWYHLWYNPLEPDRTNRRFYDFFNSFEIDDFELANYKSWVGKQGAIKVIHDYIDIPKVYDESDDDLDPLYWYEIKIVRCLYGPERDNLPAWSDGPEDAFNNFNKDSIF